MKKVSRRKFGAVAIGVVGAAATAVAAPAKAKRPPIVEMSVSIGLPYGVYRARAHELEVEGALKTAVDEMRVLFGQEKVYPPRIFEFEDTTGLVWDAKASRWEKQG